ncbi:DUF6544 family protein [Dokdonella sp.]|uniref:DUF6920 family protein n=1 Tax=Dokdonella sp. TaxID=2291710 RepID=UPI00352911C3
MIGLILACVLALAVGWVSLRLLQRRARREIKHIAAKLESAAGDPARQVDFSELVNLPEVVQRYLRHVLQDGQQIAHVTRLLQRGTLRTSTTSPRWLSFDAEQVIAPHAPGFLWVARIRLLPWLNLLVCDSFVDGCGAGDVRLLSALRIAADRGHRELDEAGLHRYLAEAVWSPSALLPGSGVHWSALDEESALATIKVKDVSVSLEFRFNAHGEVSSVYSEGRWMRAGNGYQQRPWQGRFSDYASRSGMRVPLRAEVAWLDASGWQTVWKGRIEEIACEVS